jgi:hypothetical protein
LAATGLEFTHPFTERLVLIKCHSGFPDEVMGIFERT